MSLSDSSMAYSFWNVVRDSKLSLDRILSHDDTAGGISLGVA